LPLSSYLGAKRGQKQRLQGGLDVRVPRPYARGRAVEVVTRDSGGTGGRDLYSQAAKSWVA
jgi:hypothetical protein